MHLTPDIIAFLIAIAFVAGTIDAMAGGGGLISIPALMAAGIPPVSALATNKLQSACGTASALYTYARSGKVDFRRFALPAAGAFAGAAAGAVTVQHVRSRLPRRVRAGAADSDGALFPARAADERRRSPRPVGNDRADAAGDGNRIL
jgi:uncharacterized membrane protein YfcA